MNHDKLKEEFIDFISGLNDGQLNALGEARENICLECGEFYIFPRDCRDNNRRKSIVVFDSDGQADVLISSSQLRKQLIEDAECLLQTALFENNNEDDI